MNFLGFFTGEERTVRDLFEVMPLAGAKSKRKSDLRRTEEVDSE